MTVQIDGTAPVQVAAQDEWKGIAAGLLGGKRAVLARADKSLERRRDNVRVRPPGRAPFASSVATRGCMLRLYGRAGRLTAKNACLRRGQSMKALRKLDRAVARVTGPAAASVIPA